MSEAKQPKRCFVISPIGKAGSETRRAADQVLKYIIKPPAIVCGYDPIQRADEIDEPGVITTQIIEKILEVELVIADLTDQNPNVYYELAIRHATGKPFVQLIKDDQSLPFDVSQNRTIPYCLTDLDKVESAKEALEKSIKSVEENSKLVDNPIKQAVDLMALRESQDPQAIRDIELQGTLMEMQREIGRLREAVSGNKIVNVSYSDTVNNTLKDKITREILSAYSASHELGKFIEAFQGNICPGENNQSADKLKLKRRREVK